MILKENILFANRYQLERLLGRGGFSEVWLAKDSYTNLEIAVKVYAPGQGMDSDGLKEFSAELAGVFNLNHSSLLKPTHVDVWEGMPYLIMPYCAQGAISNRIGKMTENEIWKLIHDVASGLAYLHKNDIVHQDIKPDNILLDDNGNYVITDFGISAKARSTLRKSVIGGATSEGTMAYMGPERFSKQPAPTKASDIWSFGAMVYEMITGNVPFGELGGSMQKAGAEIPEITEPVSDELRSLVEQMLAPEPWNRPLADSVIGYSNVKNKSVMADNDTAGKYDVYSNRKFSISEDTLIFSYKASQKIVYVNTTKDFCVEKKSNSDWIQLKCFPDKSVVVSVSKNVHNQELKTELYFYEDNEIMEKSTKRTLTIIQRPFSLLDIWWIWISIAVVVTLIILYFNL
ncbi:MAG: serine/threonine protein kinase [Paludibacteraceae bacterium]|nr:serine/threonine protein kinase [Paludibacteraceae bacterium]